MPPFGFELKNNDGHILVDENFRNLVVVDSGSGSASSAGNFNSAIISSQTTCPPLIFVRPASTGIEVGRAFLVDGVSPFTPGSPWNRLVYEATGNFDYKVCGLDGIPSTSGNYGLQVFNAAGTRTFDSRLPYMQVKSLHRIYEQAAASITLTVPDQGERPWFLLNYLDVPALGTAYGPFLGFSGQLLSNTQIKIRCMNNDIYNADWDAGGSANDFVPYMPPMIVMSARF